MGGRIRNHLAIFAIILGLLMCDGLLAASNTHETNIANMGMADARIGYATETSVGYATFYTSASVEAEGSSGITASGAIFDENLLTCAMRHREWGSRWKVTNLQNGKTVTVTLNDYGPNKRQASKGVLIDLSYAAFKAISDPGLGKIKVKIVRADPLNAPRKKTSLLWHRLNRIEV